VFSSHIVTIILNQLNIKNKIDKDNFRKKIIKKQKQEKKEEEGESIVGKKKESTVAIHSNM